MHSSNAWLISLFNTQESAFEKAVDSRKKINVVISTPRPEKEAIEGEVINK